MNLDEKRALISDSIGLLSTHEPFRVFMDALAQMRDSAIADAVRVDIVGNPYAASASLGEIRSYLDIFALVAEHEKKFLE